jgi:5'-deoxynucleotidase YfbR-like HD superfamily hydrolase
VNREKRVDNFVPFLFLSGITDAGFCIMDAGFLTQDFPVAATRSSRAWQRMLSGRRLDLLDPSPLDIEIEDIAHGLARVARWNGQTFGAHAYSVAQHSLAVEALVRRMVPGCDLQLLLASLLHDAPEYVIGDMISPFKAVLGPDYKGVEARLTHAIHVRFGVPAKLPATWKAAIKRADTMSAYFEATLLAGFSALEAEKFFGAPIELERAFIDACFDPVPTANAQQQFLDRYGALTGISV